MIFVISCIVAAFAAHLFWLVLEFQLLWIRRESAYKFLLTKAFFVGFFVTVMLMPQLEPDKWAWAFLGSFTSTFLFSWDELKNG